MMKFFRNNSLSIIFLVLFIFSFLGQILFGIKEYNKENAEYGKPPVSVMVYLKSGHFLEATFENWESEFLQMGLFVWLTIFLKQKGSSESKKFDGSDEVDKEPDQFKPFAPWAVRKGGMILKFYKHSLTICLFALFFASLILHFYGSYKEENFTNFLKHNPSVKIAEYISDSKFWFESFQNWQSEFLSVFAIIILSIFLRQKGSPQSKPVDSPNSETGE